MKQLLRLFFILIFVGISNAQVNESLTYQFVIRNDSNLLIANQKIGLRLSVLSGSSTGTLVYIETQPPSTNINGLATVQIGDGTVVSVNISTINKSYIVQQPIGQASAIGTFLKIKLINYLYENISNTDFFIC